MTSQRSSVGRAILGLGLVALLVAAIPTLAPAGHQASGVASYTGCLNLRYGLLYNVAVGDAPSGSCKSGDVHAHLSGGDITGVAAGNGLTGGGAGGSTTLEVDTDAIQARVDGACASGTAIREVKADGTVTCEPVGSSPNVVFWVVSDRNGNVVSSSDPSILVIKFPAPAAGQYQVRFPQAVADCAPVATIGRDPADLNTDSGLISASSFFGTNVTDIQVLTRGFNNFVLEDKPFSLVVHC